MICGFCKQPLKFEYEHNYIGEQPMFKVFSCRNCKGVAHKSTHRQLYLIDGCILLSESIRIDDFYVVRKYHEFDKINILYRSDQKTIIYKNIIGVMVNSADFTPITLKNPVYIIDCILDLPMHDIELLNNKLKLYTLFS